MQGYSRQQVVYVNEQANAMLERQQTTKQQGGDTAMLTQIDYTGKTIGSL